MMQELDLVIRGGRVVTATEDMMCDVGVAGGSVVALGADLPRAAREIDAAGRLVIPGGVEGHCHIEQESSGGLMNADDFYTGTVSAAFGGNTTIMPFACQHRGQSLRQVVEDYRAKAGPKAVIDYAFHLIISDPTLPVLGQELPALIKDGYTSFKVFMTYDLLKLDDYQMMDVMNVARREGALTMIHAENHDIIRWITDRLIDQGYRDPKYHAVARARIAEGEAVNRAISMSRFMDAPILIVHVSYEEAMEEIRRAQTAGFKVFGETCPQYLFLTAKDLDLEGYDGAMMVCSPPPRDEYSQQAMWRGIQNHTFAMVNSDHAPFRFDDSGKFAKTRTPSFKEIANGTPGIEVRMPMLYSEGVRKGRISVNEFVALTSTNCAKLFGLHPKKGTIAVGSDADIVIWDPDKEVTINWERDLHDNVGYTPYEGRTITGWPVTVINRGRVVVDEGELKVERGSGQFLPRKTPDSALPLGRFEPEADPATNFGATLY